MTQKILLTLLGCCWVLLTSAQDEAMYAKFVAQGDSLYQRGEYVESARTYSKAFAALGNKGTTTDRYNAACSWALAGEADSAFVQLFKIAQNGNYTNYNHLTVDKDLESLYGDPRWEEVKALVKANKEKEEANFDKPLVAILDTIYQEDQGYRMQIDPIQKEHGWESDEMKALWKVIAEKDSINLIRIKKILDERGWLGPDVIGRQGNLTLFLVIQHADLETQVKYLPMMREAVKRGDAHAANLALLEDRVALRQGKRQIYGSQIGRNEETGEHYVLPLEDPLNVDKRRAEVGLPPLREDVASQRVTPGPQHPPRVGVLAGELHPVLGPLGDGVQHRPQLLPGEGWLIQRPVAVGLGTDHDDAGALQLVQPPGQQRPGQPGSAGGDLVEGVCAVEEVAHDDRGPALGEDLRAPRDRAELAVVAHARSLPQPPPQS